MRASERALPMLEADEPTAAVELDPDGVEPKLGPPGCVVAARGEPFAGHQPQPPLLARADRDQRAELAVPVVAGEPGLHLAEDEAARVRRDDVQLAVARAEVRVEHGQPARLEVGAREP